MAKIPTSPPVPIGRAADGSVLTVPAERILITGQAGTGKTVLAGRIAAAAPASTVRWIIHDRHHDRAYPGPVDWRATTPTEAARMLDTALELARTPRHAKAARIRLTIDDADLLPYQQSTQTALQALADPDAGIDLTLIAHPGHLPRSLALTFPTWVLFRHHNAPPDLARDLQHLPDRAALVLRQTDTTPIVVTIPTQPLTRQD